jgi:hypothetical protein
MYAFLSSSAESESDKSHGRNPFFSSRASTSASLQIVPLMKLFQVLPVLFCGVRPDDVILWAPVAARAAAEDGTMFWLNVIGVDVPYASNRMLF